VVEATKDTPHLSMNLEHFFLQTQVNEIRQSSIEEVGLKLPEQLSLKKKQDCSVTLVRCMIQSW
jgi:hypothetical protein